MLMEEEIQGKDKNALKMLLCSLMTETQLVTK